MSSKSKRSSMNAAMHMSTTGKAELAKSEGFKSHAYNDIAKNCTVGTGILLHKGACSPKELKQNFDLDGLNNNFTARLHEAESYVRFYVRDRSLTQSRFDSLVSYVFNVGVGNAKDALDLANVEDNQGVADEMKLNVNVRLKDKNGKSYLAPSNGLIIPRLRESAPFAPPIPLNGPA